jgi:iron complex transport system ATP-binding protein
VAGRRGRLRRLEAVGLEQVSVWRATPRGRADLLRGIEWVVQHGEHWVVIGPNGAGKTTLIRIVSARGRPSSGIARVLGKRIGRYPLDLLRREIGVVEPVLGRRFYPDQRVVDVVATGVAGTIMLVEDVDARRAREALALVGAAEIAEQPFATCSEGERARVFLARALVGDAKLLVLDEPAAGLDIPGRLMLRHAIHEVLAAHSELTTITVTHDLESLPEQTSHALLLKQGAVAAAGPLGETLTAANIASCFDLPLEVAARIGAR